MFPAKLKLSIITIAMNILILSGQAAAGTLEVDGADPACSDTSGTPYCTIQAAIDGAVNGDTVLVMPNTYQENISFNGKAITVKSDQGPSVTIIDGGGVDAVAFFGNGETISSVLDGFTLQNGYANSTSTHAIFASGGGIYVAHSSPTIKNNVIQDNMADSPGFGIDVYDGSPIIDGNTITQNYDSGFLHGGGGGGGIHVGGDCSVQIINNTITNNSVMYFEFGGGIDLSGAGNPVIRNNFISGNIAVYGGGIAIHSTSNGLIAQNIIENNTAIGQGGGIYYSVAAGDPGPIVINNTITNNPSPEGSGVYADGSDAATQLTNNLIIASSGQTAVFCGDFNDLNPPIFKSNDVFSPLGTAYGGICTDHTGLNGNISVDPSFVDAAAYDYRVNPGSAIIDKGDGTDPSLPAADFAGNARIVGSDVDMGAYENAPNPGYLEFTLSTYMADEGAAAVTVTVKRKAGDYGTITVDFSTSDDTASAGSDYTAASGTITFADGDMADKSFTVSILDDQTVETGESINLVLSNPTGGAILGTQSTANLSISDNDEPPPPLPSFVIREGGSGSCFITTAFQGSPL